MLTPFVPFRILPRPPASLKPPLTVSAAMRILKGCGPRSGTSTVNSGETTVLSRRKSHHASSVQATFVRPPPSVSVITALGAARSTREATAVLGDGGGAVPAGDGGAPVHAGAVGGDRGACLDGALPVPAVAGRRGAGTSSKYHD